MDKAVLILAIIAIIAVIVIISAITKLLLIAQPNEVIILSGRKRKLASGETVGYRMIRGGRTMRVPLLEKASRMSLELIPIELSVTNAYSKGGIPLAVEAIANIKIDSTEPVFGNAVERFLTRRMDDIHAIAKDTLEGNLRGVLASLTPEEVNEDRLKFAETLIDEALSDLQQLGLKLDTLKITNISDERGYLDSIGRMKTAELIANAKKAEADKKAEAEEAEAAAMQRAETAKAKAHQEVESVKINTEQNIALAQANKNAITQEADAQSQSRAEIARAKAKQEIESAHVQAEQNVVISKAQKIAETREAEAESQQRAEKANALAKQQIETARIESEKNIQVSKAQADQNVETEKNMLRIKKAELEKDAIVKEKEAEVAGEIAKVKYEQEKEQQRIELQKKKLLADVIEPARAKKEAMEMEAKGAAASIIENGNAKNEVLMLMIKTYLEAQGNGDKVFMLNMLPQLTETIVSTLKDVKIDKITMIDGGGNGESSYNKFVSQFPSTVVQVSEMIENATGVDILKQFKKKDSTEA